MQSTSSLIQIDAARAFGTAIGNLFLAFFGTAWIVVSLIVAGKSSIPLYAGVGCFLIAIAAFSIPTMRRAQPLLDRSEQGLSRKKHLDRQFMWVNIAQWALIFLVVNILANVKLADWTMAAVMFIVGIHFYPLAQLFRVPLYYLTGTLMAGWAIAYPLLFGAGKGDPIGGIGAGAILWATSMYLIARMISWLRRLRFTAFFGDGVNRSDDADSRDCREAASVRTA